jgi:ubiquinone/menaquinone biosynthesis C-methylase UbiE
MGAVGVLKRIDYDARQHAVYSAGRALSAEAAQVWAGVFAEWAGARRPQTVLDLGSGTGRFTPMLAETFGGPVYGVEPSQRMRQVAVETAAHPSVRYLEGGAEAVPLPDRSCDLVLMFLVLHHVVDRRAAVAELRRVLRPGGRILLCGMFSDQLPDLLWHRYFPAAKRVEQQVFPTLGEVTELFGMSVLGVERVTVPVAPSLAAYAERLRLRAISIFEHLTEEEIQEGFAALDRAVAAEVTPRQATMDTDLLVLGAVD